MARRVAGKTTGKGAGKKPAEAAEPTVETAAPPATKIAGPAPGAEKAAAPVSPGKAPEPVVGDTPEQIYVGKGESRLEYLMLRLANRHGLVTGATGTGKTVTLQILAEGLARAGVPVFAADIKGDLSGIAEMGAAKEPWTTRAKEVGITLEPDQFPVVFWDLFGEQGHPIRATVSEMGPLLLSRLLDLNDTQEGVLNITFRVADEQGLLLLDLKDLRAMLGYVADNAAKLTTAYGNVSKTSVGAIQRQLLVLETQGGAKFFGEPTLAIKDFMRVDRDGRGFINILAADKLMENPRLYATFLLWLLSEMFEQLPEVGDPDKPKLVFFFDEAHLLFTDAPKALLDKIEQVVRLIRSKGVGVYFVTQNPLDVPERVLAQLGNRVQHALRAFTPRDQRAVRSAAETFRQNPNLDTAKAITELGKGEALVSFLAGNGVPSLVDRALIRPPTARVGPLTPEERKALINASTLRGKYDNPIDSESAYEVLQKRMQDEAKAAEQPSTGGGGILGDLLGTGGSGGGREGSRRSTRMSTGEVVVKQVARSVAAAVGTQLGRALIRGVLGSLGKR